MASATAAAAAGASIPFYNVGLPSWRRAFFSPLRVAHPLPHSLRLSALPARRHGVVVKAAAAEGSPLFGDDEENAYKVLGISPLDGFDRIKMAYKKRCRDAERNGDKEYLYKLEKAYNRVMMLQLQNRKKGVTQVSEEIKHAGDQLIGSWGPRYSKSSMKDMRINMAISAVFIGWICMVGIGEWKPLQFLCFAFFYRLLEKLKATEPAVTPIYNEYGEVEGRGIRMAKRVLRSLSLVFGCVLVSSLIYVVLLILVELLGQFIPRVTYNQDYIGVINSIAFLGQYIPRIIYNQELIVTMCSSACLCYITSYYR